MLRALGAAEDMAHSSLRFGIGRFTTEAEVDFVVDHIIKTVHKLREMRCVSSFFFATNSDGFLVLYGRWSKRELILIPLIGLSLNINYFNFVHYML